MFLVTPEQIGAVMALEPTPRSFAELDEQVARGLPSAALKTLIERISRDYDERSELLHRIVPESTLARRTAHLSPRESEQTERLARAFATALYVWASDEEARAFMRAPHPMLRDRAPSDVALTELGALRVEELLWRLFYGVSA
jgi:putative toxin-antitoxin system antitoxin component (TIGR02293 family)